MNHATPQDYIEYERAAGRNPEDRDPQLYHAAVDYKAASADVED